MRLVSYFHRVQVAWIPMPGKHQEDRARLNPSSNGNGNGYAYKSIESPGAVQSVINATSIFSTRGDSSMDEMHSFEIEPSGARAEVRNTQPHWLWTYLGCRNCDIFPCCSGLCWRWPLSASASNCLLITWNPIGDHLFDCCGSSFQRLLCCRIFVVLAVLLISFIAYNVILIVKRLLSVSERHHWTHHCFANPLQVEIERGVFPRKHLAIIAALDLTQLCMQFLAASNVSPAMTLILWHAITPLILIVSSRLYADRWFKTSPQILSRNLLV